MSANDPMFHEAPSHRSTKSHRTRNLILLVVGLVVVLCCGGATVATMLGITPDGAKPAPSSTTPAAEPESPSPAATPKAVAKPKPKPVTMTDGTWTVGSEVKPGVYTTTAPEFCYWARLRALDGEPESIIVNGVLARNAHGTMTVKAKDVGVALSGGCVWTRR